MRGGEGRRMVTGKLLVTGLCVGLYFSFTTPLAASSLIPSALLPTSLCLEESSNYSASLNLTVSIIFFLTLVFYSHPPNSDLLVFAYLFPFAHRLYSLGPDSSPQSLLTPIILFWLLKIFFNPVLLKSDFRV